MNNRPDFWLHIDDSLRSDMQLDNIQAGVRLRDVLILADVLRHTDSVEHVTQLKVQWLDFSHSHRLADSEQLGVLPICGPQLEQVRPEGRQLLSVRLRMGWDYEKVALFPQLPRNDLVVIATESSGAVSPSPTSRALAGVWVRVKRVDS